MGFAFLALFIAVALAAMAAVLAAAEGSLRLIPRGRVHRLAETGARGSRALEHLAERPSRTLAASAVTLAVAYSGAGALGVLALEATYPDTAIWFDAVVGGVAGMLFVFTFGEALPRTLAVHNPEGTALAAAPIAARLVAVAYPVARVLSAVWIAIARLLRGERGPNVPWITDDEYRALSPDENVAQAASDAEEEALISAVADFQEKIVREVMVPRTDMRCLEDTASLEEALELVETSGHSRLPVYHETVDDVRGVLYARDLLTRLRTAPGEQLDLAKIARPALFVPETKPVAHLLREMRAKAHMAIVADEYGGTAGLVTLEDLIEEIVGEIFDEYDRMEPMLTDLGDGGWRIDARMPVDEMNETFGTAIDLEADSVGGLFTELAGHIPVPGESVEIEGLTLTVERLEGARIRELTVRPAERRTERGYDEEDHPA